MKLKNRSLSRPESAPARRVLAALLVALLLASGLPSAGVALAQSGEPETASPRKWQPRLEFVPGEVLVRFREDAPLAAEAAGAKAAVSLRAKGGRMLPAEVETFGGSEMVEGLRLARVNEADTLEAVAALNARPDVLYAEPNYIWRKAATPNDPNFSNQYAHQRISSQLAWDTTTGSNGVVIAVIDGGVDVNHPDLQENIWRNPGEVPGDGLDNDTNGFFDDVNGWDFFHNNNTVFDNEDGDDHGTHVAGIIGARGNNGQGVAGVNWQVSIMSLKVLGPSGGTSLNFINAYNYVRTMKVNKGINVRVTNNSYGGPGFSQSAFDAIQALNSAGILFVAAAGNEASDNFAAPHYPSNYNLPNVIAVASTNSPDALSSFSNFGPRVVSMGAPGSGILSTVPTSTSTSGYAFFSGTSMAAPHVSGAAALVLSAAPSLSAQNLRGVLAFTGDVLPGLQERTTTGRRLNVRAALTSALQNDTTAPAAPGGLQIASQSGRGVTLQWTAPGDDGNAGTASDYDFFFIYPDGRRLLLPTTLLPAPGGSAQSATVSVPFRNFSGTIELRTYDDAGNFSTATVPVAVTQNAGSDPYVVTLGAAESLSTGGTPLSIIGDDTFKDSHPLPFAFPYFGETKTSVNISSNGALYFSPIPRETVEGQTFGLDAGSSVQGLQGQSMIAGLWDDLRTDRGGDVFVVQPDADRVIFRWQAVTFNTPLSNTQTRGEQPVNFEIELRRDGTIIKRYGAGQAAPTNTRLFPVVGISAGEPDAYVIASHTSESALKNLTNAQTVTYAPRAAAPAPSVFDFVATSVSALERDGTAALLLRRTGDTSAQQTITVSVIGGSATPGADFLPPGTSVTFAPNVVLRTYPIQITNDATPESDETIVFQITSVPTGAAVGPNNGNATLTIQDDDNFPANTVRINGAATQNVSEGADKIDITVSRTGDLSQPASVRYRTADSTASSLKDYNFAGGTLRFAAGEGSKTFSVLITQDSHDEPEERFNVELSNAVGTTVGLDQPIIQVAIQDDDPGAPPAANASDVTAEFVKQHYKDFLNRVPDAAGLGFWSQGIEACGADAACRQRQRVDASAAFFLAIEFQETGYLVYRTYKAAFGNLSGAPVPVRFQDFMVDSQELGRGVVVGTPGWPEALEANKQAYLLAFVSRGDFKARYPEGLTPTIFVDTLNQNAGNVLDGAERQALIAELTANNTTAGRAAVLRRVAEDQTLRDRETRPAFVLMQYFGYLRRNPNDVGFDGQADPEFKGFNFWLTKLNEFNGDYRAAEMVRAFIDSIEYRQRFGQ